MYKKAIFKRILCFLAPFSALSWINITTFLNIDQRRQIKTCSGRCISNYFVSHYSDAFCFEMDKLVLQNKKYLRWYHVCADNHRLQLADLDKPNN